MNTEDLTERLDVALDAALTVRVALGGLVDTPMPEEAMDTALGLHEGYQVARRGFVEALVHLRDAGITDEALFTLVAAAHDLAGQAAEVGWMLGVTAQRDDSPPPRLRIPPGGSALSGGRIPTYTRDLFHRSSVYAPAR